MLSDILEIHFIELKKFSKIKKDINNPLHRWLLFLINPEDKVLEEIEMADPKIKKARGVLNYLSEDEEVIRLAELRKKKIMDEISRLEGAKEEGKKEGKREGKEEGHYEEKIEVVRNAILLNLPIDQIVTLTGLSEDVIKEIIDEL